MPNLTDSFCERCGARYAFVANAPASPLRKALVVARGLKYFVLTDGQSIADFMELARNEEGREASTRMTQAFHRTFNFCLSCRQYACDRCWNSRTGVCLSCSPDPVGEPAASPAPLTESPARAAAPPAWPAIDLVDDQHAGASPGTASTGILDSVSRPDDGPKAGQWPTADEVAPEMVPVPEMVMAPDIAMAPEMVPAPEIAAAPEMVLTPEELELVETQLSHGETAPHPAPEFEAAPMPPLLRERPTWWNARPAADEDEPDAPGWALDDSAEETPQTRESDLAAAELAALPAEEPAAVDESGDDSADHQAPVEHALSPVFSRILRRTPPTPSLPPLAPPSPRPQANRPVGLFARLLGRHGPEADAVPSAGPTRWPSRRDRAAAHSWPLATPWRERSLEGRHWWLRADQTAGRSASEPDKAGVAVPEEANAPYAPEPEPTFDRVPEAALEAPVAVSAEPATGDHVFDLRDDSVTLPAEPVALDARYAVALRLSAVESAATPVAEGEGRPATAVAEPVAEPAAATPGEPAPHPSMRPRPRQRPRRPCRRPPRPRLTGRLPTRNLRHRPAARHRRPSLRSGFGFSERPPNPRGPGRSTSRADAWPTAPPRLCFLPPGRQPILRPPCPPIRGRRSVRAGRATSSPALPGPDPSRRPCRRSWRPSRAQRRRWPRCGFSRPRKC